MSWLVRGLARRARRVLADAVPDRVVLARRFKRIFGRRLDLRNPQTLNEKLHWMMLYYRPPLMSQLADKYAVRPYVAERVGPHILNELYGVWDRVADLDFARLPDTFVLKVNWGTTASGSTNCFGGEPRFLRVTTDLASGKLGTDTFDLQWQKPPFAVNRADSGRITERPSNFEEMADCARRLSRGWPYVRVDLFGVEGRTIFQELSWHPAAGGNRFIPESYDHYWGDQLQLPPPQW